MPASPWRRRSIIAMHISDMTVRTRKETVIRPVAGSARDPCPRFKTELGLAKASAASVFAKHEKASVGW